jgi:hypothetical protein
MTSLAPFLILVSTVALIACTQGKATIDANSEKPVVAPINNQCLMNLG